METPEDDCVRLVDDTDRAGIRPLSNRDGYRVDVELMITVAPPRTPSCVRTNRRQCSAGSARLLAASVAGPSRTACHAGRRRSDRSGYVVRWWPPGGPSTSAATIHGTTAAAREPGESGIETGNDAVAASSARCSSPTRVHKSARGTTIPRPSRPNSAGVDLCPNGTTVHLMSSDGAATEAEVGANGADPADPGAETGGAPGGTAPEASSVAGEAAAIECAFCEQRVPSREALAVDVGEAGRVTVCAFCADSLFDGVDVAATPNPDAGRPPEPPAETDRGGGRTSVAPGADEHSASTIAWTPTPPRGDGVAGALLQAHFLSLSLLWAIHRTNVRLVERVLEEVDVQLVTVLGLTLSAVVATGLVLATALP